MLKNCQVIGPNIDPLSYQTVTEQRGDPNYPISVTPLKEFAFCPERWRQGYQPPDSEAKDWGSLMDTLILTPQLFKRRYILEPETYPAPKHHERVKKGELIAGAPLPWNNNATFCKEWVAQQGGKEVVKVQEYARAQQAGVRLFSDERLARFVEASDKQVMVVGEWHDEETELVIPLRCLIDLVPRVDSEFYKSLGDLKTTRSAFPAAFKRTVHQRQWHVQAAFDIDMYVAATREERLQWCFVIQENYPPWQPGRELLSHAFYDIGRSKYVAWLKLYCKCLKNGVWPSYDDTDESAQGWTICEPDPWMESEGAFAPQYAFPEGEEGEDNPELEGITP